MRHGGFPCRPGPYPRLVRRTASTRTESEVWFEEYLREVGHSGSDEREPDLGIPTRPDYLVRAGEARAVCEVKQFTTSGLERRLQGPHNSTLTLGDDEMWVSFAARCGRRPAS